MNTKSWITIGWIWNFEFTLSSINLKSELEISYSPYGEFVIYVCHCLCVWWISHFEFTWYFEFSKGEFSNSPYSEIENIELILFSWKLDPSSGHTSHVISCVCFRALFSNVDSLILCAHGICWNNLSSHTTNNYYLNQFQISSQAEGNCPSTVSFILR